MFALGGCIGRRGQTWSGDHSNGEARAERPEKKRSSELNLPMATTDAPRKLSTIENFVIGGAAASCAVGAHRVRVKERGG